MRFWDSSALIPLLIREKSSEELGHLLANDHQIVASIITPIEIQSALWRRRHHDELDVDQHTEAEQTFAKVSEAWSEVSDIFSTRQIALDLITRHVLRAADALQLAAALVACGHDPTHLPFVSLDRDLIVAARAEGFTVLPEVP
jgi:predicted nucleic acid-binding protein